LARGSSSKNVLIQSDEQNFRFWRDLVGISRSISNDTIDITSETVPTIFYMVNISRLLSLLWSEFGKIISAQNSAHRPTREVKKRVLQPITALGGI